MAWNARDVVTLRREFLMVAKIEGANLRSLAREYGISPTTAYKWLHRQEAGGDCRDRSRRPRESPTRLSEEWRELIIATKGKHPTWGARKVRVVMLRAPHLPSGRVPCLASVHRVLVAAQLVEKEAAAPSYERFEREYPNELWQLDFKGHVPLRDGRRLHPLVILDDCTRFLTGVAALPGETEELVWPRLTRAFQECGLPQAVLCDNGSPWGAAEKRFTTFERKLLRLGVRVLHGRACHPQTQGKLERVNQTLKRELLARASFRTFREAQAALEAWREQYNTVRPHQALNDVVPAARYKASERHFPRCLPPIEYLEGDVVRKVQDKGLITYGGRIHQVGAAFKGERVALRHSSVDGVLSVMYCLQEIKRIDLREQQ